MMRRVMLHEFGRSSNVQFEHLPDPEPGEGQAVVAIEVAGIGYVVALCVHGTYRCCRRFRGCLAPQT